MLEYTLKVALRLEGPVLTHSTAAGEYGIDSPMARNKDEKYYLPGTLVKGKLREAMEELHEKASDLFSPDIADLFGDQTGNEQNARPTVSPRRSRLIFEDFLGETSSESDNLTRIKIDNQLGSVKKGMLQVMEAPWSSGEAVEFTGSISFFAQDQTEGDNIRSHIETGLRWITGFGSNRSVGFGRLLNVDIQVDPPTDLLATSAIDDLGSPERIDLAISPWNPFCVSKHRVSPNIFESEKIIPGNVIKGCIAELWRQLLGQPHDIPVKVFNDPARQGTLWTILTG
ncbi:MAG: hypothetical protein IPM55_18845 [Acidobacteria bacterium]|nr:hypothetical protein [Acidobacteriota bacterium]